MLRLALPSKGEMEGPTLAFLESCGLAVERPNDRQYTATIPLFPELVVLFQRAADIPNKVEEGSADLGITGYDVVCEEGREGSPLLVLYQDLGYSQCELVLAVPDAWLDVSSLADVADLSLEFRDRGRELRVATKYPRLVQRFLLEKGIHYFTLVSSTGALEAAPLMGYADLIADLASSGTTLRENRLKTIEGGTILRSQACLVGNRRSFQGRPQNLVLAKLFLEFLEARLRAADYYTVTANVPGESPDQVAALVKAEPAAAGIQGPTVAPVYSKEPGQGTWYAVTVVVRREALLRAVEHLRRLGGSSVTATAIQYVFHAESQAYRRLLSALKA